MNSIVKIVVGLFLLLAAAPVFAINTDYQSPLAVEGAETILLDEALELHKAGAVFVDVRNPRLFKRKHIAGSYHMDLKGGFDRVELEKVAKKHDPVVIYSSSLHCPRSYRAVRKAVSWGYTNVKYFRGGIVEWRDAGHPFVYANRKSSP